MEAVGKSGPQSVPHTGSLSSLYSADRHADSTLDAEAE